MAARSGQRFVERLSLSRRLECRPVDTTYGRVIANCTLMDERLLSCAIVVASTAVRWAWYWKLDGMGE